ncbi:MAG: alanine/glycine:cation symporter family protein [Planctomycetota bacterium]|jgi:AGCS family alanine or glycine:cation symporter
MSEEILQSLLLLVTGIFITFRMGWINVRYFKHAVNVIRGKYDNPEDAGDINHFQALTTALSATVGIGNIAGVALGIHYGGPGILFWLWVSGVFGMTLKFAECTLSMHYRNFDDKGNASGGPMYYIERGLGAGWKWMGITFAGLAVICSFGTGNMNQANTVAKIAETDFMFGYNVPNWLTGVILAILVGLVIIGGIRRIGAVSSKLMPLMSVLYAVGGLYIIFSHIEELPAMVVEIVEGAFEPAAGFGGAALGAWNITLLWGIKRALFSNEAGQGSAPIAHAAAKTKEPIREGMVAMLGPFVDTLCICTITGLVIIATDVWDKKEPMLIPLEAKEVSMFLQPDIENLTDRYVFENEEELTELTEPVEVKEGIVQGLIFQYNDGLIEEPVILGSDGNPYSGPMGLDKRKIYGENEESLSLEIQGRMLRTGAVLTRLAFRKGFGEAGEWGAWLVNLCVFLFGLSTIISWSYYGDRCVEYLFGVRYVMLYRLFYVCFTCLGAILALEVVWAYGDLAMGLMTVPNLIAVLLLSPVIAKLTKNYIERLAKQRESDIWDPPPQY